MNNRKIVLYIVVAVLSLAILVTASNFQDSIKSDFDNGIYNSTFYNSSGFIQMNASILGNTTTTTINGSEMFGNETGLVAYWRMNESSWNGTLGSVKDVFGKNNGTGLTGANTTTGLLGRAGNFSGTMGTYVNEVQVPSREELNPGNGSFAITGWANSLQRGGATTFQIYVSKRGSSATNGFYIGLLEGSGLNFMVGDGTTRKDTRDGTGGYANVSYGVWFHFAAVINKTSNQILLYVNGSLRVNQSIVGVGNINNTANLSIGNDEGQALVGGATQYPAKGQIDEVAIWNKSLSSSEILALYNQGKQNTTTTTVNGTNITSGTYESSVKDAGGIAQWRNISFNGGAIVGGELPNNQQSDSGISMSRNVLLYHLNEPSGTIVDSSGNRINGTQSGGVTYSVAGKYNSAVGFDGVDDYVNIPNSNSLNLNNTLTISAWIYPKSLANRPVIYSTRKVNANDGQFQLEIGTGNSHSGVVAVSGYNTWVAETDNNVLTLNEWNHVVYTRNGTGNTHKIYVNGQLKNLQTTAAYDFADNTNDKLIGTGNSLLAIHFFNGTIDEVAVFNKTLSAEEVLNLYNRNSPSSNLRFQVRTGNTNPITSDYVGSDSSSSSYFTQPSNFSLNSRYIQYKTYFNDTSKLYNVSVGYESSGTDISVSLDSPANNYLTNAFNINVTCSASSTSQLSNVTVYYSKFGWLPSEPARIISGTTNSSTFILSEITSSVDWNCYACNVDGNCAFASSNKTIIGDILAPGINLVSPSNSTNQNSSSVSFVFNATDNRATNLNCGLIIDNVDIATNSTVLQNTNTLFSYSLSNGNYVWKINCSDGINSAISEARSLSVNSSSTYTPFWAKANIHTHTLRTGGSGTGSDGTSSIATVISTYKNLGYNIIAVTDHNPYLGSFNNYSSCYAQFTNLSNNFMCINSEEFTLNSYHLIRVGINTSWPDSTQTLANVQNAVNDVNSQGGFAEVAHPNWTSTIWPVANLILLENYTGMEIYNHVIERLTPDPYAVDKWDSVLKSGKKIFGFSVDDMHVISTDLGFGFTKVYMPDFSQQSYINSMKTGYFYSSQGPNMDSGPFTLICDGLINYHMGETASCSSVSISATISATNSSYVVRNITLIKDGNVINNTICSSENCSFSFSQNVSSSGYYRLQATDSYNKQIWSNPIWVNKIALPVVITVNSPENNHYVNDYTPLINISLNQQTSLWYKLNNGGNVSLCSDCSSYTGYVNLNEGNNIIRFYANNSDNIIKENLLSLNLNFNKSVSDSFDDNSSVYSMNKVFWNNGKITLGIGNTSGYVEMIPIITTNNITNFNIEWLDNNTANARGEGQIDPIRFRYTFGDTNWNSLAPDANWVMNGSSISGLNSNNLSIRFYFEKISSIPIDLLDFKISWNEFTTPLIMNVSKGSITSSSAIISWNTNLPSNSSVLYGTTSSLGQKVSSNDPVTSHSVSLTGLSSAQGYSFRVVSCTDSSCSQYPQEPYTPDSFTTQSVSNPPSNGGGTGGSSGGGGGGGGAASNTTTGAGSRMNIDSINAIVYPGEEKSLQVVVKNRGTSGLNKCKLVPTTGSEGWIESKDIHNIGVGEIVEFEFILNVPASGSSNSPEMSVVCLEGSAKVPLSVVTINPSLNVKISKIDLKSTRLDISYEIGAGASMTAELVFKVLDSSGKEIAKKTEKVDVTSQTAQKNVLLDISNAQKGGELKIIVSRVGEDKPLIEDSILYNPATITGFASAAFTGNSPYIAVIVMFFLIISFFIVRRIIHFRKHHYHRWA